MCNRCQHDNPLSAGHSLSALSVRTNCTQLLLMLLYPEYGNPDYTACNWIIPVKLRPELVPASANLVQ